MFQYMSAKCLYIVRIIFGLMSSGQTFKFCLFSLEIWTAIILNKRLNVQILPVFLHLWTAVVGKKGSNVQIDERQMLIYYKKNFWLDV